MNDAYFGKILHRLLQDESFVNANKSFQLFTIYALSMCDFSTKTNPISGKPVCNFAEFGKCKLTLGQITDFLTHRFKEDISNKSACWALSKGYLAPQYCESSVYFDCSRKFNVRPERKNVHFDAVLYAGESAVYGILTKTENSEIVENSVHNLERFDMGGASKKHFMPPCTTPRLISYSYLISFKLSYVHSYPKGSLPIFIKKWSNLLYTSHACVGEGTSATETGPRRHESNGKAPAPQNAVPDLEPGTVPQNAAPPVLAAQGKPIITPEAGITSAILKHWQRQFPEIDITATLELLEAEFQALPEKMSKVKNLKLYIYGCLRNKSSGVSSREAIVDNTRQFICLEEEVRSISCPALFWMNQTQTLEAQDDSRRLPVSLNVDESKWSHLIYSENLPDIASRVCIRDLRQPTTVLQTLTCFFRRPSKVLTIQGGHETGKTYLSILTLREMFRRKYGCKYLIAKDLSILSKQKGSALNDTRNRLCCVPLLVIEDVEFEIKHYSFVEMLCYVIKSRMERENRPTVLTTPLKPAIFLQALGITLAKEVASQPWLLLK